MICGKYRGHPMTFDGEKQQWFYDSDNKPVSEDPNRICAYCNIPNTPEGHDGCLGTLPNVMNACCGHGVVEEAYVQFSLQNVIRGKKAINWIQKIK